jgi:hypothetical protein
MRGAGPPHGLPPWRSLRSRRMHGNLAGQAGQNAIPPVGAGSHPAADAHGEAVADGR